MQPDTTSMTQPHLQQQQQERRPHVAVLAFPFSSHAASLLTVTRHLASAAPASTAVFSFFSTHKSNRSLFSSSSSSAFNMIKAYDVTDGVPEGYVFHGKPQEDIGLFMRAAPEGFRKAMEAAAVDSGKRITCVVADAFFWFAEEIAAELRVPWVAFWTSGPSSLAAHLYTDLLRNKLHITDGIAGLGDERLNDFIPGMSNKMRLKDLPEGVLFGNLESPFSHMLLRMGRSFPRATAVALNSFEELDLSLTQHLKSHHIPTLLSIGPLNLLHLQLHGTHNLVAGAPRGSDEYGCLPWLDNQKPAPASVAYISFGSVTVPPRSELVAIAEALEASGVPFIWSLKEEVWDHGLPDGFLGRTREQGMLVPWAPQVDILSHGAVGAFVTHCGWSSLLEGIAGGVPMICRPFFGDQRLNGRMIGDVLGIGLTVEGGAITKEGLVRSLGMILNGDEGKRMREIVRHLRLQAGKALSPTGSSTGNFNKLLQVITTGAPPC
uniref:Glycosyltransferase n=1 Tax=Punica granatum TaxID=22663 RepID=A0A182B7V1_PUNGR|nr:UDP-glucose:flavonoid 3-O-glucosyltransferase [Punica granatum]